MILEPKMHMAVIAVQMANCMSGLLSAMIISPRWKSARTFCAVRLNLSRS